MKVGFLEQTKAFQKGQSEMLGSPNEHPAEADRSRAPVRLYLVHPPFFRTPHAASAGP